jgi:hypothetical protein
VCARLALALALLTLLLSPIPATAAPVNVRFTESASRGFIALYGEGAEPLAHGEVVQIPRGDRIESRMLIRFKDGSVYDETVTFTQRKVFRLVAYKLTHKGPSFPEAEYAFDRDTRHYRARHDDETSEGTLDEIPEDLHNGMTGVLLRNLSAGAGATGHILVFTPKPRVLRSEMRVEGEDKFYVDTARTAARYLVKLEIGGLTGKIASLIGKEPPDLRYWIATGPVPAFVKFEGAMFLNGPRWRIELAPPRWPSAPGATSR